MFQLPSDWFLLPFFFAYAVLPVAATDRLRVLFAADLAVSDTDLSPVRQLRLKKKGLDISRYLANHMTHTQPLRLI